MNAAPQLAACVLIASCAFPTVLLAKRTPAPVVEPVIYEGVRYTVPNDKGTVGYVVAQEVATGRQLWKKTIFRKWICPFVEHDVQWVFIRQMRRQGDRLILVTETGKSYALDVKSRRVRGLGTPRRAQARNPVPGSRLRVAERHRVSANQGAAPCDSDSHSARGGLRQHRPGCTTG